MTQKYGDLVVTWLRGLGYTHCFLVAGGNSMHLLDCVRKQMTCVPVAHEVSAGIAAEYFNERARAKGESERAFALVTAGPGLTNIVTAFAGAFLESRDLLVLGGQAKSTDLADPGMRQRGIQEIDGRSIVEPLCVVARTITRPVSRRVFEHWVSQGRTGRMGPVFLEFCLDVQAMPVDPSELEDRPILGSTGPTPPDPAVVAEVAERLRVAERPVLLLGGGVSREAARRVLPKAHQHDLPVMTTWNGADRVPADDPVYVGRPNTWGQRAANILLQQSDLVIAVGSRLGLQQTGFNWQQFAPLAAVVQVDLDPVELSKGHPRVDVPWLADADAALTALLDDQDYPNWTGWLAECHQMRALLPLAEPVNTSAAGYLDPYRFILDLSARATGDDVIVPCSSGGAETVTMQAFEQKAGQTVITDKGLASMGYGLAAAIGAAFAAPRKRVIHIEGDGGFLQNCQELATVSVNGLPIKTFLFSNEGYASIRMTQRNYFGGSYLGCDTSTGLGFPDWSLLARAFGLPFLELTNGLDTPGFDDLFASGSPAFFTVPVDPEQTYFPKITSRVTATGSMESNPLHLMSPELPGEVAARVLHYLEDPLQEHA
ncbi:MAG: thiamine pyrophosphate-binding protein [Propionibacteriaceae bacterium]|nr:thiamine pyrophosphate-binding protein [Propionibacteriaceae bacterium]